MTKSITIAVIQYPGTNCEYETASAIRAAGMTPEIFRWNRDLPELDEFDGYVIPGGFSYQDRIRAGAVGSKKAIVRSLARAAEIGKPILGICNGAQILVESGLVPGISTGTVEMSLAGNRGNDQGRIRTGYHCDWTFIKNHGGDTPGCFNLAFKPGEIIPVPVAHAEGRFITGDTDIIHAIEQSGQIGFQYCDTTGNCQTHYPVNPNGTVLNIAGLYNKQGNVLAFMPHPERAAWMRQVPGDLPVPFNKITTGSGRHHRSQLDAPGPGARFFESMKLYIQTRGEQL